jgi:hypothetical protein
MNTISAADRAAFAVLATDLSAAVDEVHTHIASFAGSGEARQAQPAVNALAALLSDPRLDAHQGIKPALDAARGSARYTSQVLQQAAAGSSGQLVQQARRGMTKLDVNAANLVTGLRKLGVAVAPTER